jgi:transcriptional regulator with GAF, ATPase, and Fis domain
METLECVRPDLWKEVCRHLEIPESLGEVVHRAAALFPPGAMAVCELDPAGPALLTLASAGWNGASWAGSRRVPLAAGQAAALSAWWERGEVDGTEGPARGEPSVKNLLPLELEGFTLLMPLSGREPPGVLVINISPPHHVEKRHEAAIAALAEILAAALGNHRRLRDLTALRAAAEAEKQALLQRLGRSQLVDKVVGADTGLGPVLERVDLVARADLPVLILGETGSGKEVIARAIHARSPRAGGAFVRVNCGAIPLELVDSQLFGHERGSFTGATETRQGWFERADGGTLFLDEVGELPLAAQVRLLRILQDGDLERVGGRHPIHVNVRVVAATHRDLAAMVAEGRFREDLWYRIAVFPITLPPLRDRPQDIPALAVHFAERAARRFGVAPCLPGARDVEILRSYAWPGNVRELATVIDRAVILGNGRSLEVSKALGLSPRVDRGESVPLATGPVTPVAPALATLDAVVRAHIEAALKAVGGRIEGPRGAAAVLAVNPHTLRARMRKLGIDWRSFRANRRR